MLTPALALVLSQLAPPGETAEADIEHARVMIQNLYEEKGLALLAPWLKDDSLPPSLRARAFVYAGIAQLDLADEPAARESFRAALQADRGAVLPGWVSRRIRAVFDAELAALAALAPKPLEPPPAVVAAPTPPPVIIQAPPEPHRRQAWVGIALGLGVSGLAGLAGLTYWKMRDSFTSAVAHPVSVEAERLNGDVRTWYGVTWGLSMAALLLVAGFVLWAVNLQTSG